MAAAIGLAATPVEPPTELWGRIDAALTDAVADNVIRIERFADGGWRSLAPGVRYKRLWDRNAMLLECQPEAVVPDHEHPSYEHALVLRGDLISDLGTFLAGDYHGLPAGDLHKAWTTKAGCLVLIQYAA